MQNTFGKSRASPLDLSVRKNRPKRAVFVFHKWNFVFKGKPYPALADYVATHEGTECFGNGNRAILVLEVFQNSGNRSTNGKTATI